jgi:2,3-bisphosphoglycerate-dependent phosphoglycerate mutase/probable phosphoglycerate mutase
MELYIIRHAQSSNNALADERERVCDPHLTDLGRQQAELLAAHLTTGPDLHPIRPWLTSPGANGHGYGITRLYTSPMRRCLQTTLPIARTLGLTPEVWVDIHEHGGIWLDHGEAAGRRGYPGITRSELSAQFPGYAVPDRVSEAGWWRGAYEELEAAEARAERVAETLRGWGSLDEKIAIVSHGAFGSLLLCALLGEATQPVYYHLDNTSISLIRFRRVNEISVRYLNRLAHLPAEMIT